MGTDHYKPLNGRADWIKYKTESWGGQFNFFNSSEGWVIARRGKQIALPHTSDSGQIVQRIKPIISHKIDGN